MKISFKTDSSEQTEKFGEALSRYLEAGTVITLDGDLGAGKTCLTRGIARGLGAVTTVASPTFTIVNEYEGGGEGFITLPLYAIGLIELNNEQRIVETADLSKLKVPTDNS